MYTFYIFCVSVDIDECTNGDHRPCVPSMTCQNFHGGFTCVYPDSNTDPQPDTYRSYHH